MNKIVDKIVLLICCTINLLSIKNSIIPAVLIICLIITCSALCQCYEKSRVSLLFEIVYIVLCFINPTFCFMLPIIIYDVFTDKNFLILIFPVIAFILSINSFNLFQIALILSYSILSIIINNRTLHLEELEQKLIETRDNSTEINMLLIEKNKHLCESQDYEIYLATLKERNRIAREIHDNVGHMLSRMILQVGALLIINKDEKQKESLESIKDSLNTAMDSIRQSVHNLHNDSIDLKQSIIESVKSVEDSYKVSLDLDFSNNVSKNIKFCFIGVIKEGIANIIKHSNGDKINITVREHPAFYQLTIEDNGKNTGLIQNSGIGLSNMKERVNNLGGIIEFSSNQMGFKIFVSITKK